MFDVTDLQRADIMEYDTAAKEMKRSGGSFAGNLGEVWMVADLGNRRRLLSAFKDTFDLYMNLARERAKQENPSRPV